VTDPLDGYPIVVDFPVAWGDMDAFGHVNNTKYFRWFEDGRLAYFAALDLDEFMRTTGVGPILASTECRFRIPLAYPDSVRIGATVSQVGDDFFTMRYAVLSTTHQKVAADGEGRVVAFDYAAGRKTRWPDEMRRRIATVQA
jgi:acyl-CoA thioester hydrolase